MASVRVKFQVVKLKRTFRFKCAGCGKQKTRVLSEWSTINPFNNMSVPGVHAQVRDKLRARVVDFTKRPMCAGCEGKALEVSANA